MYSQFDKFVTPTPGVDHHKAISSSQIHDHLQLHDLNVVMAILCTCMLALYSGYSQFINVAR